MSSYNVPDCIISRFCASDVINPLLMLQSVEGEPHEKAVELLKAAQGRVHHKIASTSVKY